MALVGASEYTGGRDTQKTQHGIETFSLLTQRRARRRVETLRKPSTGLKPGLVMLSSI